MYPSQSCALARGLAGRGGPRGSRVHASIRRPRWYSHGASAVASGRAPPGSCSSSQSSGWLSVASSASSQRSASSSRWSLVLHHHHSGEDAVLWPLLLVRAPREIDPVVRLMEGHHQAIDEHLATIGALLGTWTSGAASEDGEALAIALERLAVAAYEHMGLEEKLVLPITERHVFASEWDTVVANEAASIPPDVGPMLAGMLMYEAGPDVVPWQMRAVLAEVAPRAYGAVGN
jgi:hypothetical protein